MIMLEIKIAESGQEKQDAITLLDEILYTSLGLGRSALNDDLFFIAVEDGLLKGSARLCLDYEPLWKIAYFRGVTVLSEYQNQGIGRKLYNERKKVALKHGKTIGLALIREDAKNLYKSEGYEIKEKQVTLTNNGELVRYWVVNHDLQTNLVDKIFNTIKKEYPEREICEILDEEILNWVEEDWEDEYEDEYEWYAEFGRGEAEQNIVNQIIISWVNEHNQGKELDSKYIIQLHEKIKQEYPLLNQ